MIRVGRCTYDRNGNRTDPTYPGFTSILVLMRSHSEWGCLGPYELVDQNGIIFENYYQASKVYPSVPETTQRYSRWNNQIIWQHPAEIHYQNDQFLPAYWTWRHKLMHNRFAVRYPVGFNYRSQCLFAVEQDKPDRKLDYIESRMKIYLKKYCELVRCVPKFTTLQQRLNRGENLLIIEVDGPRIESLPYYKSTYNVSDDFIENNTMLATEENLHLMLLDNKHPFGHGYCLAIALLEFDYLGELDLDD